MAQDRPLVTGSDFVDIVFDGPPDHKNPEFIEVESSAGRSIRFGEWIERDGRGYRWALRIPRPTNIEEILAALYKSEINVSISWFWDGGIDVKLGDPLNGYGAEDQVLTLNEAADWLRENAVRLYPDSDFARRYARGSV
jgi:hypothetical protein